jgi:hypothetical protein
VLPLPQRTSVPGTVGRPCEIVVQLFGNSARMFFAVEAPDVVTRCRTAGRQAVSTTIAAEREWTPRDEAANEAGRERAKVIGRQHLEEKASSPAFLRRNRVATTVSMYRKV